MRALFDRWERFWFAEGSTRALGAFRILFGLTIFGEVGTNFEMQQNALEGGFHVPYLSCLGPLSEDLYRGLHLVQWPASLLLAAGVAPRLACAVLLASEGRVFLADHLHFRNHAYLVLLITGLLLLSPCGRSFSLASLWRRGAASVREFAPLTAQRLIQFQISVMYFWSAVNKLSPGFRSGEVLAVAIGSGLDKGLSGAILGALLAPETLAHWVGLASRPENMLLGAYGTIAIEFFLAFALWWRRTRTVAILVGIAFHVGIGISMDIGTFGLLAVSSYVLFTTHATPTAPSREEIP